MRTVRCLVGAVACTIAVGPAAWTGAKAVRAQTANIRISVEMVQLDVAVTDNKGKYVTGLRPEDFTVAEDGIGQSMAMFAEGDNAPLRISEYAAQGEASASQSPASSHDPATAGADVPLSALTTGADSDSPMAGASVFILFDTSNYMYHGFVFAQDAIASFVRSLQGPDRIALYSYSRDLFRSTALTPDRLQVLRGVRQTVAGDNAAMYDAILLTLRDAAALTGRRVIVVFSNGPDNASLAPPEDIEELAQSEGVAIYMISTHQAQHDPVSIKVFNRISASTGGELYFANNWQDEKKAFDAIREDLSHLYTLYYYPQANPNRGWRAIAVKLKNPSMSKYRIRARSGYRPLPVHASSDGSAS